MSTPTLMPALVTPFTRGGTIDEASHVHNVRTLSEAGIEGFLLAGSTGEGPLLETGERALLTRVARDHLGSKAFLMVGLAAESVRQALAQAEEAADAGADAVLVLTPTTLARTSLPAQRNFFTSVANGSPIPTLLYSVPRNTGYPLDEALAVELSELDNVIGMKDSGGDAARIQRIVDGAPDDFVMYNGASASLQLALAGGAHGAITASTNYAWGLISEVVRTARRAPTKVGPVQARLTAVSRQVESHGIPGVKAAAAAAGLAPGSPRSPFRMVPKPRREAIEALIADI